jgi:hypothetical protein
VLRGMQNDQHGAPVAVIAQAPPSAEDAFAVLPQNLTIAIQMHAAHRTRWAPGHTWLPNFISADQTTRRHAPGGPSAPVLRRGSKNGPSGMPLVEPTGWIAVVSDTFAACRSRSSSRFERCYHSTPNAIGADNRVNPRVYQRIHPGAGTHPPVRLLALRVRALHPARPRSGRARS